MTPKSIKPHTRLGHIEVQTQDGPMRLLVKQHYDASNVSGAAYGLDWWRTPKAPKKGACVGCWMRCYDLTKPDITQRQTEHCFVRAPAQHGCKPDGCSPEFSKQYARAREAKVATQDGLKPPSIHESKLGSADNQHSASAVQ